MTTVVITDASRGMDACTARHLAAQGCTVFAGARRPDQLRREGADGGGPRRAGTSGDPTGAGPGPGR